MGDNPGASNMPPPTDQSTTQLATLTLSTNINQPGTSTDSRPQTPAPTSNNGPPVQVSTTLTFHVKPPEHATHLENIPKRSISIMSPNGQHSSDPTSPLETHASTMAATLSSDTYSYTGDVTQAKPPPTKRKRALSASSLESNTSNSTESGTEGYSTPQLQLFPGRNISAQLLNHVNSDITCTNGRRTHKCLRRSVSATGALARSRSAPTPGEDDNIQRKIFSFFKADNIQSTVIPILNLTEAFTTVENPLTNQLTTSSTDHHSVTTTGATHSPPFTTTKCFTTGATNSPPISRTAMFGPDNTISTYTGTTPIPSILPIHGKTTKGTTPVPTITISTPQGSTTNPVSIHTTNTNTTTRTTPVPTITINTPQGGTTHPVSTHTTNTTTNMPNAPSNRKQVAFQFNPTISSTLTQNALSVSLQADNRVIAPRAEEMWRKARNHMSGELKARARMAHIDRMILHDIVPAWALGIECIPGYLTPANTALTEQKHMHARETLRCAKEELLKVASQFDHTAQSYLQACQINYGADHAGWTSAKQRLADLIGTEKAELKSVLNKRFEALTESPINDEQISDHMFRRLPHSNFTQTQSRVRDRSPQAGTSWAENDRESRRGREDNRRSSPSNRGRGRGRSPRRRSRSSSRSTRGRGNRGNFSSSKRLPQQDSRSNYNSRPNSDNNSRTNNAGPNYNSSRPRGQDNRQQRRNPSPRNPRGPRNRQDNLSNAELALIQALRDAKQ